MMSRPAISPLRASVMSPQALEAKQIADAKHKEMKQALDESEKRSEALTRELASVRENECRARNLAAARERDVAQATGRPSKIRRCQGRRIEAALDEVRKGRRHSPVAWRRFAGNDVAARNLAATRERRCRTGTGASKSPMPSRKELKQALDESERGRRRSRATCVRAQDHRVGRKALQCGGDRSRRRQALEARQIADAKQKELKQALEESEKKLEVLAVSLRPVSRE